MGDYGFKDTIKNSDVYDTAVRNLATTSEYPVLKSQLGEDPPMVDFVQSEPFNVESATAGTFNLLTIPYSYSYLPANLCIASYSASTPASLNDTAGSYFMLPKVIFVDTEDQLDAYVDEATSSLKIDFIKRNGFFQTAYENFVLNVKYYIFDEDV